MMLYLKLVFGIRALFFRLLFSRKFARWGKRTLIVAPISIERPENIELGANVYIAANSGLSAFPHTGAESCRLVIGDGSKIGRFNHLYATAHVELGRKVLTANGVYISDNRHGFEDTEVAIVDQPIVQLAPTFIGDGTWIGHNAAVYGVRIGRNCVIGANSVVTRDIPDFCVAVGAPARVIKRFDPETRRWRKTSADGRFSPPAAQEPANK